MRAESDFRFGRLGRRTRTVEYLLRDGPYDVDAWILEMFHGEFAPELPPLRCSFDLGEQRHGTPASASSYTARDRLPFDYFRRVTA